MLFTTKKYMMTGSGGFSGTGGDTDIIGNYTIHVFKTSGTLTLAGSGFVDVLIVAGGGGGGWRVKGGGGGGAGGLIYLINQTVSGGTYNITVGNGGAGNTNGGHSSIIGPSMTLTAVGGGRGGGGNSSGASGGSGGGGGSDTSPGAGGSGTSGQGNRGASASGSRYDTGGSGGGAGAAGATGNPYCGGNGRSCGAAGGVGRQILIADGLSPALGDVNHPNWYAGGGASAGQLYNNGPGGNWGSISKGGGGGAGAGHGQANTGGGGTAGNYSGGSGIVIVRYLT